MSREDHHYAVLSVYLIQTMAAPAWAVMCLFRLGCVVSFYDHGCASSGRSCGRSTMALPFLTSTKSSAPATARGTSVDWNSATTTLLSAAPCSAHHTALQFTQLWKLCTEPNAKEALQEDLGVSL